MLDGESDAVTKRNRVAEEEPIRAAEVEARAAGGGGGDLRWVAVCRQREWTGEEIEAAAEEVLESCAVELGPAVTVDGNVLVALEMCAVEPGNVRQLAGACLATARGEHDADHVPRAARVEQQVVRAVGQEMARGGRGVETRGGARRQVVDASQAQPPSGEGTRAVVAKHHPC